MKKLDIGIGSVRDAADEFLRRVHAIQKGTRVRAREQLYFADMPTLLRTLTSERWRLIEHVRRYGPLSINAASKQLQRNYKNVHSDVGLLMEIGLIEKLADGTICVPYDSIVAELKMAA